MFPPRDETEKYIMLPFFWIPEDTIPIRVRRASVPYDVWRKQGYLMATEGNVIHYGFIEQFVEELGRKYHILEIAFDRWGAVQMTQDLEGMGFTVVPFGQGYKDMSPPTKVFYKLLVEGRIQHGGHPVMRWMSGNVVVDTDPAGNIKCTKAKSPEKAQLAGPFTTAFAFPTVDRLPLPEALLPLKRATGTLEPSAVETFVCVHSE